MSPPVLFLSHAGVDTDAALALADRLENAPEARSAGLKVWIDKRGLVPGDDWKLQIDAALKGSTAFAVYIGSKGTVNWVWDEVSAALDRVHLDPAYRFIPILTTTVVPEDLPSFVMRFHGVVDVEQDPAAFQQLIVSVLGRARSQAVGYEDEPFQGLEPFSSGRSHLFFGREVETAAVVDLLRVDPLVMVTGDSGSGKSSLVRAGVVPRFRGGALTPPGLRAADCVWQVFETRPLGRPFEALATAVRDQALGRGLSPTACSELAELIRTGQPGPVRDALRMAAPADARILLIVDQFEELFTLSDPDTASAFAKALVGMVDPADDRIRIVMTLRLDYYHLCSGVPELYERLESRGRRARYVLRRMTTEGLRRCITEPLRLASVPTADREELANGMLPDVEERPNDLALLEMALSQAWSRRDEHGGNLLRAYVGIGRVDGALAVAAERTFSKLSVGEQALAEALFIRLVKIGELGAISRRVASRTELSDRAEPLDAGPDEAETDEGRAKSDEARTRWAVAQKLARREFDRLVVVAGETAEIAHEALVRSWPRYLSWLRSDNPQTDPRNEDKVRLDALMDDARRWSSARATDRAEMLAKGHDLQTYSALAARRPAWLSSEELAFVKDSNQAHQQSQWLARIAIVLLIAFAGFAALQWWRAQQRVWENTASLAWRDLALDSSEETPDTPLRALWTLATAGDEVRERFLQQLRDTPPLQLRANNRNDLIAAAAVGLDPQRALELADTLLDVLEAHQDRIPRDGLIGALAFVEGRVPASSRQAVWLRIGCTMMYDTDRWQSQDSLPTVAQSLAKRLSPEQRQAAWTRLFHPQGSCAESPDPNDDAAAAKARGDHHNKRNKIIRLEAAAMLVADVSPEHADDAWDEITALIPKASVDQERGRLEGLAQALGDKMPEPDGRDRLKALLASTDHGEALAEIGKGLARSLDGPTDVAAWDTVVKLVTTADTPDHVEMIAAVIEKLAGQPPAASVAPAWTHVMTTLEASHSIYASQSPDTYGPAALVGTALVKHVSDDDRKAAWPKIVGYINEIVDDSSLVSVREDLLQFLAAMAKELPEARRADAWRAIVPMGNRAIEAPLLDTARTVAGGLAESERTTAMRQVIAESRRRGGSREEFVGNEPIEPLAEILAPRLTPKQADELFADALALLNQRDSYGETVHSRTRILTAIIRRLPENTLAARWKQLIALSGVERSIFHALEQPLIVLAERLPRTALPDAWTTVVAAPWTRESDPNLWEAILALSLRFEDLDLDGPWKDAERVDLQSGTGWQRLKLQARLAERLSTRHADAVWPAVLGILIQARDQETLDTLTRAAQRLAKALPAARHESLRDRLVAELQRDDNPEVAAALGKLLQSLSAPITTEQSRLIWDRMAGWLDVGGGDRLMRVARAVRHIPAVPNEGISERVWHRYTLQVENAYGPNLVNLLRAGVDLSQLLITTATQRAARLTYVRSAIPAAVAGNLNFSRLDSAAWEDLFAAAYPDPTSALPDVLFELLAYPTVDRYLSKEFAAILRRRVAADVNEETWDVGAALDWYATTRRGTRPSHPANPCAELPTFAVCRPFNLAGSR
jgi:hypothetical protein